jgi:hypothetical protein
VRTPQLGRSSLQAGLQRPTPPLPLDPPHQGTVVGVGPQHAPPARVVARPRRLAVGAQCKGGGCCQGEPGARSGCAALAARGPCCGEGAPPTAKGAKRAGTSRLRQLWWRTWGTPPVAAPAPAPAAAAPAPAAASRTSSAGSRPAWRARMRARIPVGAGRGRRGRARPRPGDARPRNRSPRGGRGGPGARMGWAGSLWNVDCDPPSSTLSPPRRPAHAHEVACALSPRRGGAARDLAPPWLATRPACPAVRRRPCKLQGPRGAALQECRCGGSSLERGHGVFKECRQAVRTTRSARGWGKEDYG